MIEIIIMLRNQPLIYTTIHDSKIYQKQLLPWTLKGISENNIYEATKDWITNRIIHYNQNNGNWLWNYALLSRKLYGVEIQQFAITFHLTSVYDEYWVKAPDDPVIWEEIDPKRNPINQKTVEIQLGFAGGRYAYCEYDGDIMPAYTTYGNMQKAWMTDSNGIFLYKRNDKGCHNAENEVRMSRILDRMEFPHVVYEKNFVTFQGRKNRNRKESACRCRPICEEGFSLIHAEDIYLYCKHNNIDFHDFIMSIAKEDILKMCIIDYLFGNPDRHMRNWGFIQDDSTGDLSGLAPLFDHDRCFSDITGIKSRIFPDMTMKDAAMEAIKKTGFQMQKKLYPWMFPSITAYLNYQKRYREIFGN